MNLADSMDEDSERRISAVRALVSDRFVGGSSYHPERVGKRLKLHEVAFPRSLIGALLDDNFTVTESFFADSTKPLATVLAAIALLVEAHPACWVQVFVPDGAYAEIGKIWIADPVYTEHVPFLLETEKADQGGPYCIALFFEDGEGMIIFERRSSYQAPHGNRLLIAFHGTSERRKTVIQALACSKQPKTT